VKLKISSEITGSIETTICLNSPWMILFQHCVRQSRLSINMANVAKIEKGDDILIFSSLKLLKLILRGQVVLEENILSNCGRTDDGSKLMTKWGCILFPIRGKI
jgi:hypothetical protein